MSKAPLPFDYIIVHATATPPDLDVDARWVDRVHRRQGWTNGCGYHEVITRSGERQTFSLGFPTRPLHMAGAHVGGCGPGWNKRCLGISMAGGINEDGTPEDNFTDAQWRSLREAVAFYQALLGIPDERVIGHRDLIKKTNAAPKACPCFSVQEKLFGQRFGGGYKKKGVGSDNSAFRVPQKIKIPHGETLWGLSRLYGVSVDRLLELNPKLDPNAIRPGTNIRLIG